MWFQRAKSQTSATTRSCTPWDALVGDASVRDPRMVVTVDVATETGQCTACRHSRGEGHSALRITRVARDLEAEGARTSVHSICAESFEPAMAIIAGQILEAMSGACLDVDAEAGALCEVVEDAPDGCEGRHGRVPFDVGEDGRILCKLCQGDADGQVIDDDVACQELGQSAWFYREADSLCPSERPRRIEFGPLRGTSPLPTSPLPTSPRLLCPGTPLCN